jgi:hypothetical protein
MDAIIVRVPNIRYLKITGAEYDRYLDFFFLEACPNLETFHFNHLSVVQHNAAQFTFLKSLVEIDLDDTHVGFEAMLTLLQSLPRTLQRFRHLSRVPMKHFWCVAERFPQLEEFCIAVKNITLSQVPSCAA